MSSLSRYGSPVAKATPDDAGCYIDGHWGIYATHRLLELAWGWGFRPTGERDALLMEYAAAVLATSGPSLPMRDEEVSPILRRLMPSVVDVIAEAWQVDEEVIALADDAEAWLNEYVAPEGFAFAWEDGEFFLSPIDDEDASYWERVQWADEDREQYVPEPECELCMRPGHTFRSCPTRDDAPY